MYLCVFVCVDQTSVNNLKYQSRIYFTCHSYQSYCGLRHCSGATSHTPHYCREENGKLWFHQMSCSNKLLTEEPQIGNQPRIFKPHPPAAAACRHVLPRVSGVSIWKPADRTESLHTILTLQPEGAAQGEGADNTRAAAAETVRKRRRRGREEAVPELKEGIKSVQSWQRKENTDSLPDVGTSHSQSIGRKKKKHCGGRWYPHGRRVFYMIVSNLAVKVMPGVYLGFIAVCEFVHTDVIFYDIISQCTKVCWALPLSFNTLLTFVSKLLPLLCFRWLLWALMLINVYNACIEC